MYPIILAIVEAINGSDEGIVTDPIWNQFSYSYTCIIVFVIIFLITMKRDLDFFLKLNTWGVLAVFGVILFVIAFGLYAFSNTSFDFYLSPSHGPSTHTDTVSFIYLFDS